MSCTVSKDCKLFAIGFRTEKYVEVWKLDDDENGFVEGKLIDEDEDGVWEILVLDTDENGKSDQAFLNLNTFTISSSFVFGVTAPFIHSMFLPLTNFIAFNLYLSIRINRFMVRFIKFKLFRKFIYFTTQF